MSIFNKSPAGSVNLIFIASVKASYGMVGEEGEFLEGEKLSIAIGMWHGF